MTAGFGRAQLAEMQAIISAQDSDLYDVLAYAAYNCEPVSRTTRAEHASQVIATTFNEKQKAFLDFLLAQYVKVGVEELASEKLSPLLKLKYHNALSDAFRDLGEPAQVKAVFEGFQQYLYQTGA